MNTKLIQNAKAKARHVDEMLRYIDSGRKGADVSFESIVNGTLRH